MGLLPSVRGFLRRVLYQVLYQVLYLIISVRQQEIEDLELPSPVRASVDILFRKGLARQVGSPEESYQSGTHIQSLVETQMWGNYPAEDGSVYVGAARSMS